MEKMDYNNENNLGHIDCDYTNQDFNSFDYDDICYDSNYYLIEELLENKIEELLVNISKLIDEKLNNRRRI